MTDDGKITPQEEMQAIFSYDGEIQAMLDFEASLAGAQAKLGIIPREAAEEIQRVAKVENMDRQKLEDMERKIGHPIAAFVRVFQPLCKGDAGQYFHWGITSQDVQDTAHLLRLKMAYRVIFQSLRRIEENVLDLAEVHASTVMAGRSHAIHAGPITFGFKMAVWAREVRRHIQRMQECHNRVMVGHVSDAVGTMASMGQQGPAVEKMVLEDLGLGVPDISWQASRDRPAEFANLLSLIAGTLGRLARMVLLLSHTEIAEIAEPWEKGMVGSSAMPHKRNPILSEMLLALSRKIKYNAALVNEVMVVDHERDLSFWLTEQGAMIETMQIMGELLTHTEDLVGGMVVFPERMKENLDILQGMIVSEKITHELGKKIGKLTAYGVIYEHAQKAISEKTNFKEMLANDPRITEFFSEPDIVTMLDPNQYLGVAKEVTLETIQLSRRERDLDRVL